MMIGISSWPTEGRLYCGCGYVCPTGIKARHLVHYVLEQLIVRSITRNVTIFLSFTKAVPQRACAENCAYGHGRSI